MNKRERSNVSTDVRLSIHTWNLGTVCIPYARVECTRRDTETEDDSLALPQCPLSFLSAMRERQQREKERESRETDGKR